MLASLNCHPAPGATNPTKQQHNPPSNAPAKHPPPSVAGKMFPPWQPDGIAIQNHPIRWYGLGKDRKPNPKHSMYGLFTYNLGSLEINVRKYTTR